MKRLVFGLFGTQENAGPAQRSLRELTISWSRYGYQGDIIEAETLDELLQKVSAMDAAYCFVQKAGHVIDEQWYPPCWNREGFHQSLSSYLGNKNSFLVIGTLTGESDNGNNSLKDECFNFQASNLLTKED